MVAGGTGNESFGVRRDARDLQYVFSEEKAAQENGEDAKGRNVTRYLEDAECKAFVQWLRLARPVVYAYTYHIPNGGYRHIREASKFKAIGVKAGVPDFHIALPTEKYHGAWIEMKAGKGKPSKPQLEWLRRLSKAGYACRVCWGWEEAKRAVEAIYGDSRGGRK